MPILSFDKPQKLRSTAAHNATYVADSAPPGAYVPNMSQEDRLKWKAKHFNEGKENARIEISKSFQWTNGLRHPDCVNYYAQTKIIVQKQEPRIIISSNGKVAMTAQDFNNFQTAINEALQILNIQQ